MLQRLTFRFIAVLLICFIVMTSAALFLGALTIWAVTVFKDRRLRLLHRFTCWWASLYIHAFPPWTVEVTGRENIDPEATYVIVSNHQSMVDILVAFTLSIHFKWVSKAEIFWIPLIGWNMLLNRYVRLVRGDKRSIRRMYAACERHLSEGSSVYLFPEGTRSESGQLKSFKEGAFALAKRHQVPILPLVIHGSRDALPKSSLNFHGKTHIRLEILPPISPEEFASQTPTDLATRVREQISERLSGDPEVNY